MNVDLIFVTVAILCLFGLLYTYNSHEKYEYELDDPSINYSKRRFYIDSRRRRLPIGLL